MRRLLHGGTSLGGGKRTGRVEDEEEGRELLGCDTDDDAAVGAEVLRGSGSVGRVLVTAAFKGV